MPRSVTSVFSEPDDFQAALREDGAEHAAGRCSTAPPSRAPSGPIRRSGVFQHRGETPPIDCLKVLACFTYSPPRWGPNRRRLGPHRSVILTNVSKG